MSKIEGGGPAFPCETVGTDKHGEYRLPYQGMTLRDYFAAKAMQGVCAGNPEYMPVCADQSDDPSDVVLIARTAYAMADAMLAAREGKR